MSIPSNRILKGAITTNKDLVGTVTSSKQSLKGSISGNNELAGKVGIKDIIKPNIEPEIIREFVEEYMIENPPEPGKTPVKGVDYFTEDEIKSVAKEAANFVPIDDIFTTDDTLYLDPITKVLKVNTATEAEMDNTRPITSAAVATQIGNIEILLRTI